MDTSLIFKHSEPSPFHGCEVPIRQVPEATFRENRLPVDSVGYVIFEATDL